MKRNINCIWGRRKDFIEKIACESSLTSWCSTCILKMGMVWGSRGQKDENICHSPWKKFRIVKEMDIDIDINIHTKTYIYMCVYTNIYITSHIEYIYNISYIIYMNIYISQNKNMDRRNTHQFQGENYLLVWKEINRMLNSLCSFLYA